jgi:hypothetical protein
MTEIDITFDMMGNITVGAQRHFSPQRIIRATDLMERYIVCLEKEILRMVRFYFIYIKQPYLETIDILVRSIHVVENAHIARGISSCK